MEKSYKGGTSLSSMLLILFITLKLTGVIDWSWWWVLAPFWVPLSLAVLLLTVAKLMKQEGKDSIPSILTSNNSRRENRLYRLLNALKQEANHE